MSCLSCAPGNQAKFTAEMNIHFSGLNNIDKPSVWVFPKVLVCLHCGSSQFSVPTSELALLAEGTSKEKDPMWQALFQEAILELDREVLNGKIREVEVLISERLGELPPSYDRHDQERQAIDEALSTLRVLKAYGSSYPD